MRNLLQRFTASVIICLVTLSLFVHQTASAKLRTDIENIVSSDFGELYVTEVKETSPDSIKSPLKVYCFRYGEPVRPLGTTPNPYGNGNITEYVDDNQAIVAHYEYGPFGKVLHSSGSKAGDFRYQFSTKPLDTITGLHYYGYRWYDSSQGRWINRDPIKEDGGLNVYDFCGGDPINCMDVLGLQSEIIYLESPRTRVEYLRLVAKYNSTQTSIKNTRSSLKLNEELGKQCQYESRQLFFKRHDMESEEYATAKAEIREKAKIITEGIASNKAKLEAYENVWSEAGTIYDLARIRHYEAAADSNGNVSESASKFSTTNHVTFSEYTTTPCIDPIELVAGAFATKVVLGSVFKQGIRQTATANVVKELVKPNPIKVNTALIPVITGRNTVIKGNQLRHLFGHKNWYQRGQGGYFFSKVEAQRVLDAYHCGNAKVLGYTGKNGKHLLIEVKSVTGYNMNVRGGFLHQPTHRFEIKGVTNVSVVPVSPIKEPSTLSPLMIPAR